MNFRSTIGTVGTGDIVLALTTGFALTFARAIGEYGSVVFVSSNTPFKDEIAPVIIVQKLEELDNSYAEATAVAVVLLIASFAMLIVINSLERRTQAANSSAN